MYRQILEASAVHYHEAKHHSREYSMGKEDGGAIALLHRGVDDVVAKPVLLGVLQLSSRLWYAGWNISTPASARTVGLVRWMFDHMVSQTKADPFFDVLKAIIMSPKLYIADAEQKCLILGVFSYLTKANLILVQRVTPDLLFYFGFDR